MNKKLICSLAAIITSLASVASTMPDENRGKNINDIPYTFSVSFPKAGQHSVTGFAEVVLSDGTKPNNPDDYVQFPGMYYRWRYFDKVEECIPKVSNRGNWNLLYMVHYTNNIYRTIEPINIPNFPCDLEFFFSAVNKGRYYKYVDYSGLNLGTPGYTEDPGIIVITNEPPVASFIPSFGDKHFYRIRKNDSNYRGVTVEPAGN